MSDITREQVSAAVQLAIEVGGIIRDLGQVPSGLLYGMLQNMMNLPTYESLITLLVNQSLVRRGPNHMLIWIGDEANGSEETQRS